VLPGCDNPVTERGSRHGNNLAADPVKVEYFKTAGNLQTSANDRFRKDIKPENKQPYVCNSID
jgi:hypothetical protein